LLPSYDTIIVGAGSAGCVLANRLSADPQHKVLLIEGGGSDNYIWIKIPVGYLFTISNPRTDWCFKTEAEKVSATDETLNDDDGGGSFDRM